MSVEQKLIYIADDERNILNIISSFLEKEGYLVETFTDGQSLVEAFHRREADLLVIDIMMPGLDGYEVCTTIRQISTVPIIIVSAKDTEPDRIVGLTLGSDDYLTKPFSPLELVARVKSLFRRIEMDQTPRDMQLPHKLGDIVINPNTKQVMCRGQDLQFTALEFAVLQYMANNRYRAVSREELLDKIWGVASTVETRATDDTVKRIRKKLSAAHSVVEIETVWGFGFRIKERDS